MLRCRFLHFSCLIEPDIGEDIGNDKCWMMRVLEDFCECWRDIFIHIQNPENSERRDTRDTSRRFPLPCPLCIVLFVGWVVVWVSHIPSLYDVFEYPRIVPLASKCCNYISWYHRESLSHRESDKLSWHCSSSKEWRYRGEVFYLVGVRIECGSLLIFPESLSLELDRFFPIEEVAEISRNTGSETIWCEGYILVVNPQDISDWTSNREHNTECGNLIWVKVLVCGSERSHRERRPSSRKSNRISLSYLLSHLVCSSSYYNTSEYCRREKWKIWFLRNRCVLSFHDIYIYPIKVDCQYTKSSSSYVRLRWGLWRKVIKLMDLLLYGSQDFSVYIPSRIFVHFF